MNALGQAITEAFKEADNTQKINKAYLEFIKANFIIPIEKDTQESPKVLFLKADEKVYLPVFSDMQWLDKWALEVKDEIELLKLSGIDLLKGLGDDVYVCLDIGSLHYKEFNPSETARMRSQILKLFR